MSGKKGYLVLFLFVFALGAFLLVGASTSQAKTIKLSYSNFFPPTHIQAKLGKSWAEEVQKRTDGQVEIDYYPGGALLKGPKMYDGVLKGITDIGMSLFAYTRGIFPAMEAVDLPMGYPNGKVATQVVNDFYEEFDPEELSEVKVLYLHAHGPGLLHSKKEVRKMEDVEGLKIRSTGFSAKVSEALGAVPVAMGQGGAYEALQKGVVDATFSPMEVLKGWKQAEVIDYTVECYSIGYTTGFYVIMNLDKWNSLPEDVQDVLEEVSAEWIAKHGEAWDSSDEAGREYTKELGNEIVPLSEEESARWAEQVEPVIEGYIKDKKADGLPADEYVDFIESALE